jgi:hypothetical protein
MKLGETVHFDVTTRGDSGVVDADSAPTFSVFENATDTPILADVAMTKRTALTGNYRGTFDATTGNGFESGKWYNVIVTGIVGGVTDKTVALTFPVRTNSIDDVSSGGGAADPLNNATALDVKLGETRFFDFVTVDPATGFPAATFTSVAEVHLDDSVLQMAYNPTIVERNGVGHYTAEVVFSTANGFVVGSNYAIAATVAFTFGGQDYEIPLGNFMVRAYSVDDIAAKTNLIGTAAGELNAPLTNGSLLTLYKNGDYKLADNRAVRVTLPAGTYPDITGATCRLGVTKSKDNTGGFVVEASAQSGSAVADQTIDFELDHATETGDIEPAYAYGWTCRVVYPGVDPLTQWDNLDPISGKVKVLEDRVGNAAP